MLNKGLSCTEVSVSVIECQGCQAIEWQVPPSDFPDFLAKDISENSFEIYPFDSILLMTKVVVSKP